LRKDIVPVKMVVSGVSRIFLILVFFVGFQGSHGSNTKINNGIMKLIVKAYVDELLAMARIEDEVTRNKLMDLGDHIVSHPALRQKHLYVGQEPPNFDPDRVSYSSFYYVFKFNFPFISVEKWETSIP